MLSQICFRQIQDNFWYGQYGNFDVVIDKSNGFVNATKLCSDGGKHFYHWKESKVSKELIKTLEQWNFNLALEDDESREPWAISSYAPVKEVVKSVITLNISDEDKAISGTYCHPLLIPHIACWVSPTFALKSSSIINYFITEEWQCRLQAAELVLQQRAQNLEDENHALCDQNLILCEQNWALEDLNATMGTLAYEQMDLVDAKKESISD